jgi:hypothetical protein
MFQGRDLSDAEDRGMVRFIRCRDKDMVPGGA